MTEPKVEQPKNIPHIFIKSKKRIRKKIEDMEKLDGLYIPKKTKEKLLNFLIYEELTTHLNILRYMIGVSNETKKPFFQVGLDVNKDLYRLLELYDYYLKAEGK